MVEVGDRSQEVAGTADAADCRRSSKKEEVLRRKGKNRSTVVVRCREGRKGSSGKGFRRRFVRSLRRGWRIEDERDRRDCIEGSEEVESRRKRRSRWEVD